MKKVFKKKSTHYNRIGIDDSSGWLLKFYRQEWQR